MVFPIILCLSDLLINPLSTCHHLTSEPVAWLRKGRTDLPLKWSSQKVSSPRAQEVSKTCRCQKDSHLPTIYQDFQDLAQSLFCPQALGKSNGFGPASFARGFRHRFLVSLFPSPRAHTAGQAPRSSAAAPPGQRLNESATQPGRLETAVAHHVGQNGHLRPQSSKPPKALGKQLVLKRTMVEQNGESTPSIRGDFPFWVV